MSAFYSGYAFPSYRIIVRSFSYARLKLLNQVTIPFLASGTFQRGITQWAQTQKTQQQQQTNKQTKNGIDSNIITDNYTGLNGLSLTPGFHS